MTVTEDSARDAYRAAADLQPGCGSSNTSGSSSAYPAMPGPLRAEGAGGGWLEILHWTRRSISES